MKTGEAKTEYDRMKRQTYACKVSSSSNGKNEGAEIGMRSNTERLPGIYRVEVGEDACLREDAM